MRWQNEKDDETIPKQYQLLMPFRIKLFQNPTTNIFGSKTNSSDRKTGCKFNPYRPETSNFAGFNFWILFSGRRHPQMGVQFRIKSYLKTEAGFASSGFPNVMGGNKHGNAPKTAIQDARKRIC